VRPHLAVRSRSARGLIGSSFLAIVSCGVAACSSSSGTPAPATDAGNHADVGVVTHRDGGPGKGRDAASDAAVSTEAGLDAGEVVDAGSDAAVCPVPTGYGGGEATIHEGSVVASLVDETGAPVAAGQPLFICGINICANPGMTSAGGTASLTTSLSMKKPAFKFGDSIAYAEFGIPLTAAATDFTMMGTGKIATAKLTGKPGAALTPGSSATSGDVTVAVPSGATVGINELIYSPGDPQLFRSAQIPLTNAARLLPATPSDFALLYGIAPAETTFCPPAQVTVTLPATLGWQPGAAVEFWVTTTDTGQVYAPYAGWALMSDGAVSADGKSATTTPTQGFQALENFAVRLKN
jgi:hypothetical protein